MPVFTGMVLFQFDTFNAIGKDSKIAKAFTCLCAVTLKYI